MWADDNRMRLAILGDSLLVSQWTNAAWFINDLEYFDIFRRIWNLYFALYNIRSATEGENVYQHIFREHNTYADTFANKARLCGNVFHFSETFETRGQDHVYAQIDGSMSEGTGGAGVILFISPSNLTFSPDDQRSEVIAFIGVRFLADDALQTETVAFVLAYALICLYFLDSAKANVCVLFLLQSG